MALSATVEATYQGYAYINYSGGIVDWVTEIRNHPFGSGTSTYTSNSSNTIAIRASLQSGRGGYTASCNRVFLFFDGLDTATGGGTIISATLKVWGAGSAQITDTIVVKGTAWGGSGGTSTLSTLDYANLDHSTAYSSKDLSWGGSTYNDFALNSTAIADMNANGYLNCAVIEGDYDYDNQSPTVGTSVFAGVEFLDPTNPIKLNLTYLAAGYGNDVIDVASANIDNVIGVATEDIDNIIGV